MVFNMVPLDLARDIYDDSHDVPLPASPPSSSATLCCNFTLDLTATITIELACRRKLRVPASATTQDREEDNIQVQQGLGRLSEFTLKELKVATSNFRSENLLGRGGFGRVYRAQLANGHAAAIKRCEEFLATKLAQFQGEVKLGNMPNHRNILPLLGFCAASKQREYLLVYPLMVNGSVASCLRERTGSQPPLSWSMRMNIALGAARGLRHLHRLNIIHRDIKAANILLDDKFEPLIGDFGIAIFAGEWNHQVQTDLAMPSWNSRTRAEYEHWDLTVTTTVRGTIGHIAPEYLSSGSCSRKTDIFAFGVMLLELLTGQHTFDLARLANNDDVMLLDWVKGLLKENRLDRIMDQHMQGHYDEGQAEQLIKIALMCTLSYAEERPNADELVQFVKGNGWHERWGNHDILSEEEYQRLTLTEYSFMVRDSASHLQPEELSGPR